MPRVPGFQRENPDLGIQMRQDQWAVIFPSTTLRVLLDGELYVADHYGEDSIKKRILR